MNNNDIIFLFWSRVIKWWQPVSASIMFRTRFLFVFVFLFLFWTEWSEDYFNFFNDFLCLTRCSSTTWMRDYQGIFGLFTGGWKRAFLPLTFLIIEFPWDEGAWLSKQLTCHAPFLLKISRSSRDFQSLCWELIFFLYHILLRNWQMLSNVIFFRMLGKKCLKFLE